MDDNGLKAPMAETVRMDYKQSPHYKTNKKTHFKYKKSAGLGGSHL